MYKDSTLAVLNAYACSPMGPKLRYAIAAAAVSFRPLGLRANLQIYLLQRLSLSSIAESSVSLCCPQFCLLETNLAQMQIALKFNVSAIKSREQDGL